MQNSHNQSKVRRLQSSRTKRAVGVASVVAIAAAIPLVIAALGVVWFVREFGFPDHGFSGDTEKLPIASQTAGTRGQISSIAITNSPSVWVYGIDGFGSNSGVMTLNESKGGGGWEFGGQLDEEDRPFTVHADFANEKNPFGTRAENLRDGATAMEYVESRDRMVWVSSFSGRLLASKPRDVRFVSGTETRRFGRAEVLCAFQERSPSSIAVSPDAHWIAVGFNDSGFVDVKKDGTVLGPSGPDVVLVEWLDDGCVVKAEMQHADGSLRTCCFTSEGDYVVSGGDDSLVRFWSIPDGKLVDEWQVEAPLVDVSTCHGRDRIAYATERGHVVVRSRDGNESLSLNENEPTDPPDGESRYTRPVRCAYSPDGQWLAVAERGQLRIFRAERTEVVAQVKLEGRSLSDIAWSPTSEYIGIAFDDVAYVLEVNLEG